MDFKDSLFDIKNQMLKEQEQNQKSSQNSKPKEKLKRESGQENRKEKEQKYYANLKERQLALSEELRVFMNV